MIALMAAATAALVVGFLAGFVTFKRSLRWCPGCGAVLRCPECPRHRPPYPVGRTAGAGIR